MAFKTKLQQTMGILESNPDMGRFLTPSMIRKLKRQGLIQKVWTLSKSGMSLSRRIEKDPEKETKLLMRLLKRELVEEVIRLRNVVENLEKDSDNITG